MDDSKLQEIHDFLITIAHKAGEMILAAKPSTKKMDQKKNAVDLVTETDQAVETFVSRELRAKYPDYDFIGEETYNPATTTLTAAPTFIVDPIDGTTNFIHSLPHVCISLGLAINHTPTIGVIYNPFLGHLYTAIRGAGAYLTTSFPGHPTSEPRVRERLPLRPPEKLENVQKALVAVEWGSDRAGNDMRVKAQTFARLMRADEEGGAMAHSLRSFGSAALNLCGVAAGQLDAYWEAGCFAWDVCAGWCVLEEAGGVVVGANPGEWRPAVEGRRYLAVRGDGEGKGERVEGREFSKAQVKFIEEFWSYVEGEFEVGK